MAIPRVLLLTAFVCAVTAPLAAHLQTHTVVGAWRYNPELSTPVPQQPADGERRRGGGGGRPPGGGGGGRGGGIPGMGRGGGPSEDDMRRMRVIIRRVTEPPAALMIVRDGAKVVFTDGDGRTVTYVTDGKKEERVTGDGEFSSKARFEGDVLIVEEDFGGGVKLTTRVAPIVSENRERLEITLKAAGLPKRPNGGGPPPDGGNGGGRPQLESVTRVYERER
jgi:hypothetical protein